MIGHRWGDVVILMQRDLWPVKLFLGGTAAFIGASDLTFPGQNISAGVLLFVGLLLLAEGYFQRKKGD